MATINLGIVKETEADRIKRAAEAAGRAYQKQCQTRATEIEGLWRLKQITKWEDLRIDDIPLAVRSQPLEFITVKAFLTGWVVSAPQRYAINEAKRLADLEAKSNRFVAAVESSGVRTVGRFKLRPRQRKCIDLSIQRLYDEGRGAVGCFLEGGEGKSVIGWGLIKYADEHQFFGHPIAKLPINQATFITKPSVKINMTRRGIACGVRSVGRALPVWTDSQLSTKDLACFFTDEVIEGPPDPDAEDPTAPTKITRKKYILPPPAIIGVDECHVYKKQGSVKSQYLAALIRAGRAAGSKFLYMSATPFVCLNDTWAFVCSTGHKWNGEEITLDNFSTWAKAFAGTVGATPNEASPEVLAAFRKEFSDYIVLPPRDPKTVRAYNSVKLVDFENERDKKFYQDALDRYVEQMEREGKGGREVNKLAAMNQFRDAEEWIKAPYFARMALESHANGFAPVIGVSRTATVKEIVRKLCAAGVPRNKISVVWGGNEIVSTESLEKIIGPRLFKEIGSLVMRFHRSPDGMTPEERTAVRRYLTWAKEQARNNETEAEQAVRHKELMKLRLDASTPEQRQDEIDKFQNGDTEYCIFTLPAGGTGVDLDHQVEGVRPREGFFTICYYVEEFLQALYRTMRLATLSDVRQHMVFFRNTIVADHVAPILDKKIKSVSTVLQVGSLVEDVVTMFTDAALATKPHVSELDLGDGKDTVDEDVDTETLLAQLEEEE
jgi:hypothetical protein